MCNTTLAQRTAKAVASVINGFVVSITLTDGGLGYTKVPVVNIIGGGGTGATAVAILTNGSVKNIIVSNAGNGYTATPSVTIDEPPLPAPALVAYYPFNGSAHDESGADNHGSARNVQYVTDRFGKTNSAAYFNGFQSGVMVYDNVFNIGQAEYTISFWFNPAKTNQILTGLINTIPHTGVAIVFNNDHAIGYISFFLGNAKDPWDANWIHGTKCNYQSNMWYLITFIKQNQDYKLYVNGVLDCSYTSTRIYDYEVGLRFGTTSEDMAQVFNGTLDDIRIYNYALDANSIYNLYRENGYSPVSDPPDIEIFRAVKLQLNQIIGLKYELQYSLDLNQWISYETPFVAATSKSFRYIDAQTNSVYWRLQRIP